MEEHVMSMIQTEYKIQIFEDILDLMIIYKKELEDIIDTVSKNHIVWHEINEELYVLEIRMIDYSLTGNIKITLLHDKERHLYISYNQKLIHINCEKPSGLISSIKKCIEQFNYSKHAR